MKLNKKGFTVIEGLLIVIALTLIIGVGYYVINANKDSSKSDSSATKNQTAQKISDAKTQEEKNKTVEYIELKEIGIKINKTDKLANFSFEAHPGDGAGILVGETNVTKLGGECKPSSSNFAVAGLFRSTGKYDSENTLFPEKPIKEFDDFYINVLSPDGGIVCDTDEKTQQLEASILSASNTIIEAVKNSEKL